jgi:predicted O-methyltransferase YrrM
LTASFEDTLRRLNGVQGWLRDDQARHLWETAGRLTPPATVVEIGSYHGRSAIVMASGAPEGVEIVAIDPHAGNDRGPMEWEGTSEEGEADNRAFWSNLERAGVAGRVRHVRLPSQVADPDDTGTIDLLYLDGAHRYRPARADLVRWGPRLRPGRTMLVHDAFSSIGLTIALVGLMASSRDFRYLGRLGTLAEYRRERVSRRRAAFQLARHLAQFPYFVRNEIVKVAILRRWRWLQRLLGHREGPWPY